MARSCSHQTHVSTRPAARRRAPSRREFQEIDPDWAGSRVWADALSGDAKDTVVLFDTDRRVRWLNQCAEQRFTRASVGAPFGVFCEDLHVDDWARLSSAMRRATDSSERQSLSVRVKPISGDEVTLGLTISSLVHDGHQVIVLKGRLPTPTGVFNARRPFGQKIHTRLQSGAAPPFAVLYVEIEEYRRLISARGRAFADRVEREVRKRLSAALSERDELSAFGGAAFAIIVDDVAGPQVADELAKTLREEARKPLPFDSGGYRADISVGVADSRRQYAHGEEVLEDATAAARRSRGRRRHVVFQTAMRIQDVDFISTACELDEAIEEGQLQLHYQPIVGLPHGDLLGFEALVRWNHPIRGMISPAKFIPVAEKTGAIVPLGRWVLETACSQLAAWSTGRPRQNIFMSINLSAKQLACEEIFEHVAGALSKSKVDPSAVKLEVTETSVLDVEAASDYLSRLKKLGVRLALDDFGTGYSSLSHLHRLPIDTLKVDRSFVSGIKDGRTAIVAAIVSMAHHLGLNVIAEGIETQEEAQTLFKLNCTAAQGYLFSRPLDVVAANAVVAGLKRRQR